MSVLGVDLGDVMGWHLGGGLLLPERLDGGDDGRDGRYDDGDGNSEDQAECYQSTGHRADQVSHAFPDASRDALGKADPTREPLQIFDRTERNSDQEANGQNETHEPTEQSTDHSRLPFPFGCALLLAEIARSIAAGRTDGPRPDAFARLLGIAAIRAGHDFPSSGSARMTSARPFATIADKVVPWRSAQMLAFILSAGGRWIVVFSLLVAAGRPMLPPAYQTYAYAPSLLAAYPHATSGNLPRASQSVLTFIRLYCYPGYEMGDQAEALLLALKRDVYVWRVATLDSACFFAEHGPVLYTEMITNKRRKACES